MDIYADEKPKWEQLNIDGEIRWQMILAESFKQQERGQCGRLILDKPYDKIAIEKTVNEQLKKVGVA